MTFSANSVVINQRVLTPLAVNAAGAKALSAVRAPDPAPLHLGHVLPRQGEEQ